MQINVNENAQTGQISRRNDQNGGIGVPHCHRRTPNNANFHRHTTNAYCWTNGGCAHTSRTFTRQAAGHQTGATFENHMGGSNAF